MTDDTIHPALASALEAKGYHQLTPVQAEMAGGGHGEADLLVSAQTGSGKTVAFGIAIASTLLGRAERFPQADLPLGLVIAPTRELAIQVQRELDWLYADAGVRIATCVGGMDMRRERRALDSGAHIVVGTPGRLRDHISKGALDLSALRAVVLDEADEMLDLGFREDLEFILGAAPEDRRTLLFSATVPRGIADLARNFQKDAVRIAATAATEQHADIEYQLMLVRRDEREHAVINTLLDSDSASALVFCHTREAVRHLTARLANRGFSVVSLSGEMAQSERSNALQSMRDGRAHVCVATDVAARGIDLPNLDLVIHADVPSNPATLLHRSGRTGRAGRKGVCVLIV
ncbi:MAG: DEAD/DEAH box helicase, partial [Rudaea sp.]|nr:DEAD/DEAH box helicase [Rudaea sp.]